MKTVAFIHRNDTRFAVGDFSPVLSVFSHYELGNTVSPFLLLDHIGPGKLRPSSRQKGVNAHPHRGFETVTLVYTGEIEHRDSSGGGGIIAAGDVQWMTAAKGIVHQEFFSEAFTQHGGRFEMIQLWVNLPAKDKMQDPHYQSITTRDIPVFELPNNGGKVRVIAGQFQDLLGPAQTYTPINVFDAQLSAGQNVTFNADAGHTALIFLRSGRLQLAENEVLEEEAMAVMSSREANIAVHALEDSQFIVLTGEPIQEPINAHGPFIMNTHDEIVQAYDDFKSGQF
ncbi:MAG: pirin family protein [Moraxellaceae bacterium]|nr:pirin family protein [Moraxellaceae bacterium]MDZ4387694.1 pirin family protein [Moraxellaceae bacterium]